MIWGMLRRLEGSATRIRFIRSLQSSETRMLGGKPYSTLSMRCAAYEHPLDEKEKEKKDYAFRRQFNKKPNVIPGCPRTHLMHR